MVISVLPSPVRKKVVTEEEDVLRVLELLNREEKHFDGFVSEAGGWMMKISYGSTRILIAEDSIRVGIRRFRVSPSLLFNLLKMVDSFIYPWEHYTREQ